MSGKLDQSLDDIVKTRRHTRGRAPPRRAAKGKTPIVGGIAKNTRPAKSGGKLTAPIISTAGNKESKILVSGLPVDITEVQIKDYFSKTIGPVKKVFLTYGPEGRSRGISTIVFTRPQSAHEAVTQLNGVKVDQRAMRIEVIVGADQAPAPKALGERIGQPKAATAAKNKPKSAAAPGPKGGRNPRKGRNAGRGKPKTAEELDAEMTDYFVPKTDENAVTNGAASGGDTAMDDQIL